ncbi:hypothetical protein [Kitasatospora sp. NPDC088548]|uniref:hypothetical protein n=1 Tax=Kitasatospora sp. NPDC088548 TaxID=3364075 RepID=UPI00381A4739
MSVLAGVTAEDLSSWDRPDSSWVTYWAHEGRWSQYETQGLPNDSRLMLPTGAVPVPGLLADGLLRVWVDTAEGWLWAALPKDAARWASGEVPSWVRWTGSDSRYPHKAEATIHEPVMVRRRLADGEAVVLLDQVMPPVGDYQLPPEWAQVLRLGGWYPRDLTAEFSFGPPVGERRVWWRIEDLEDAQALARSLPAWWKHQGWPLDRTRPYRDHGPLARHLALLVDEGIPAPVAAAHREVGKSLDLDTIRASVNPAIPNDATRVRLTRSGDRPYFALNAQSARTQLAKQNPDAAYTLVHEVHADRVPGLVPLHVDPAWHLVVWSDGAVHAPAEVYQPDAPHIGGEWAPEYQRLAATAELVKQCTRASNWAELQQERPWESWLDADGVAIDTPTTVSARAHGAERTVTLTRYAISLADAQPAELWKVEVRTVAPNQVDPAVTFALYTSRAEAEAAFAVADDGLPPVMTVPELAKHLGVKGDTLRQALHRERRKRHGAWTIGQVMSAQAEPGWVGTAGPPTEAARPDNPSLNHLHDPRVVLTWWHNRPGHGPGRGHTGAR